MGSMMRGDTGGAFLTWRTFWPWGASQKTLCIFEAPQPVRDSENNFVVVVAPQTSFSGELNHMGDHGLGGG